VSSNVSRRIQEVIIEKLLKLVAVVSIAVLVLIFLYLFRESGFILADYGVDSFLLKDEWRPTSEPPQFGALAMIADSGLVAGMAGLVAIPLGFGIAIYLAEGAPRGVREVLKALIELLAGIPSIIYGFVGLFVVAPIVRDCFGLTSGLNGFTASLILAVMALPTIVSIADDALRAVPYEHRHAAYALGATRWETTMQVVVPAARTGLVAAGMLGVGRAIGETMAVLLVAGNATIIPQSIFSPVRTITADIAAEMGETVFGGEHYQALFALGLVLFIVTFVINVTADVITRGARGNA
jgi:phosphate transport system permease protein